MPFCQPLSVFSSISSTNDSSAPDSTASYCCYCTSLKMVSATFYYQQVQKVFVRVSLPSSLSTILSCWPVKQQRGSMTVGFTFGSFVW